MTRSSDMWHFISSYPLLSSLISFSGIAQLEPYPASLFLQETKPPFCLFFFPPLGLLDLLPSRPPSLTRVPQPNSPPSWTSILSFLLSNVQPINTCATTFTMLYLCCLATIFGNLGIVELYFSSPFQGYPPCPWKWATLWPKKQAIRSFQGVFCQNGVEFQDKTIVKLLHSPRALK